MSKITILNVKVNNISFKDSLKVINNFILQNKPHQIVTVNPEFIMTAQNDMEFLNILNNASLSVPDGVGLLFVSKYFLGKPLIERIAGIDLVWSIAELASKYKYPIYLLGAEEGIAKRAANKLKQKFPGLVIAGTYAGKPKLDNIKYQDHRNLRMNDVKPSKSDPNLEIIKIIRKSNPKILLVAYGAPKQDKFISRYKNLLNIPVMIGVGGAFDFIAGKSQRAPRWIQKIGFEWLWRLFHEPWRFGRIFTAAIKFPFYVLINRNKNKNSDT